MRISHESISLDEEKRLIKEIKTLEKTRPKVSSNAAKRAKMQDTVVERDAIQDQVKVSISCRDFVFYCAFTFCINKY